MNATGLTHAGLRARIAEADADIEAQGADPLSPREMSLYLKFDSAPDGRPGIKVSPHMVVYARAQLQP